VAGGLEGSLPVPITISAGLAAFDPAAPPADPFAVMRRADEAMRQAKSAGRNRVVVG